MIVARVGFSAWKVLRKGCQDSKEFKYVKHSNNLHFLLMEVVYSNLAWFYKSKLQLKRRLWVKRVDLSLIFIHGSIHLLAHCKERSAFLNNLWFRDELSRFLNNATAGIAKKTSQSRMYC